MKNTMNLLGHQIGGSHPLFLIAGPCVIENERLVFDVAEKMKAITQRLGVFYIFKASFDKANRTSEGAFRGLGRAEGLRILSKVRRELDVPVLTDVHEKDEVAEVAAAVDMLQTPAFLVRQTDFIQTVARAGKPVNIKKGQFLAPQDMKAVVEKCRVVGNSQVTVCERGVSFGYNTLVSDMRGLAVMRQTGCPVVFDATHSAQEPGGLGHASGGQARWIPTLARAAVGAGVAGIFMETHPEPSQALSDAATQWPLARMEELVATLVAIDRSVKARPLMEDAE